MKMAGDKDSAETRAEETAERENAFEEMFRRFSQSS
jgi:hypothetical protein